MNEDNIQGSIAADISQVVGKVPEAKAVPVEVVTVQRLQERDYKDPTPKQYVVERQNHIGTPLNRETAEGIAMIHKAIHSTGEQPVW